MLLAPPHVMQGEFYTKGRTMTPGLQPFDPDKARDERPEYVLFNGRMGALMDEGALTALRRNVQTTLLPTGGAAIVELRVEVPGLFLLVDHSISRAMDKGALGSLVVTGDDRPDIFRSLSPEIARRHSGH